MATPPKPARRKKRPAPAENPITFYPAWCKRCGLCAAFCPKSVLEIGADGRPAAVRPQDCARCRLCELRCPDFALSVAPGEDEEVEP